MSERKLTPFALSCSSCGASMHFDIVNQNYACAFCANTELASIRQDTVEAWADLTLNNLKDNKGDLRKCECPNCGSTVNTLDDSQTLECFACGSTMITADFALSDEYPVAVIPFKLTLDEAKELLKKELGNSLKKLSKKYKNAIIANLDGLREIYLPFQLFTGPVDASVMRYGKYNQRGYELRSYMNQKVVIACENVDNDLIERVEPFNMDDLVPFEFNYIAGHQAKTQDSSYNQLYIDFQEEIKEDMRKALSKKLGTEHMDVEISAHDECSVPVLLPVFTLNVEGAKLSINGQTCKIAVKDEKEKVSHKWVLAPLLYTAIIAGLTYYFADGDIPLVLGMSVVFGLIIFAIYSDANRRVIYNKVFATEDVYTREGRRLSKAGFKFKPTFETPVFYEEIDGEVQAVDVKFFPLSLKVLIVFLMIVSLCLPEIIVLLTTPIMLIAGTSLSQILKGIYDALLYTAAWKCLAVPLTFVGYFTFVKQGLYDRVYARKYGTNDKFKCITGSLHIFRKVIIGIKEIFLASFWMGLFLAFLIFMSTLMIYTEGIYGSGDDVDEIDAQIEEMKEEYEPILDERFAKYKDEAGLGDEYEIYSSYIYDYDDDGNIDAVASIGDGYTYTHLLYFDLDDEENRLKDEVVFDREVIGLIAKKDDTPIEKEWCGGIDYISTSGLQYESVFKVNVGIDEALKGFILYVADGGNLDVILNLIPSGESDQAELLAEDGVYYGYSRKKADYETFYYGIDAKYVFDEGMIKFDSAKLTVPEGKISPSSPEEVVARYVELSIIEALFVEYNQGEDKWKVLPVDGLVEELEKVTSLDFDDEFLWEPYLVESISLEEEPVVAFTSEIDGDKAVVHSEIIGEYPYDSVCSAGDGVLIDYKLEKKGDDWIVVEQYLVEAQ